MRNKKTIVLTLVMILFTFMLTSCGSKKAMTADEFKSAMENEGYTINDISSQYTKYGFIDKAYLAVDKNKTYQIEFYEMTDDDKTVQSFNTNKENFEKSKNSSGSMSESSGSNYNSYSLTANNKFKHVARIDSTMIYLDVPSESKDEVTDMLDKIGY